MADKSLAQQLAAMQEQMAALMAAASGGHDEVTAKVLANAPKARTQRAAATAAKATAVERNLTARLVTLDGKVKDYAFGAALPEGVTFVVMPQGKSGTVYRNGSRVQPYVDGSPVRGSWPLAVVDAFSDDLRECVRGAIASVDERALIGAHKPAEVAA